jgi:hypothetical protein
VANVTEKESKRSKKITFFLQVVPLHRARALRRLQRALAVV